MTTVGNRTADHPIDPMFLDRWSPRAFTGESVPEADLMAMFEAARWAPSSYNSQPWRFVWARRESAAWPVLLGLLNEFNQSWAKTAGALVILASSKTMVPPGKETPVPAPTHSLDAGSAWGYLALQATKMGWHTHAMAGFDTARAATELGFPDGFHMEAAIAIGRKGDPSLLPEGLAAREMPSGRQALSAMVFEGRFGD